MNQLKSSDIFELIDCFEENVALIRSHVSGKEQDLLFEQVKRSASYSLERYQESHMLSFATYYSDKFYRIVGRVSVLDETSLDYLKILGKVADEYFSKTPLKMIYFVDNHIPPDRLQGVKIFFSAMGWLVYCLEDTAERLANIDGSSIEQVLDEAVVAIFGPILQNVTKEKKHILAISHTMEPHHWKYLWELPEFASFHRLFRNQEPLDGSQITGAPPNVKINLTC